MLLIFLMGAFAVSSITYVALQFLISEPSDGQREALAFCYTIANGALGALFGAIGGAKASS